MDRSGLYGDKAYKMDYYSESEPLHYWSDQAGRFFTVWMVDKLVIDKISKFHYNSLGFFPFRQCSSIFSNVCPFVSGR